MVDFLPLKISKELTKRKQISKQRLTKNYESLKKVFGMNVKKIEAIKNLKTGFIERNVKQWNKNSNWKSKNEPTKQIKRVQENNVRFLKKMIKKRTK